MEIAETLARWSERLSASRPRGVVSLASAIAIHAAIAVSLLMVWPQAEQTAVEPDHSQAIAVSLVAPEPAPTPAPAPAPEPTAQTAEAGPATSTTTAPPAATRPEPSTQSQQRAPAQPAQAQEPSSAPASPPARNPDILTAPGGQAAFAPDAPQPNAALRGVVCSTGSPEMRAAIGCGGAIDGPAGRFTAYADSTQAAQIGEMFDFSAPENAFTGFTVDFSGRHTPSQVFSQHSHFASGAHTAFGQLPVAERARDPGFGD